MILIFENYDKLFIDYVELWAHVNRLESVSKKFYDFRIFLFLLNFSSKLRSNYIALLLNSIKG